MNIKGNARGNPGDLAKHLEKKENESVRIVGIHGLMATDIKGALEEMDLLGTMLKTRRTLYSMSISPAPGYDFKMTDEEWDYSERALLIKMQRENQPYISVEHIKKGDDGIERKHRHLVIAQANTEKQFTSAIRFDHNYRKHEEVARHLERYLGHPRVQGAHAERFGIERPERTPTQAEMQQAKRTGIDSKQAKALITELWRTTDSAQAMNAALESHGWKLARGDKPRADGRAYLMAIDPQGGTHELRRCIQDVKAAEIYARMDGIDPASLPSVREAKLQQLDQLIALETQRQEQERAAAKEAQRNETQRSFAAASATITEPQQAPEPPDFAAASAKITERPVPTFDRDAAEREWNEKLIAAAIAHDENPQRAREIGKVEHWGAAAARGRYAELRTPEPEQEQKPERPLSETQTEMRMALKLSRSAQEFEDALAAHTIGLAAVTPEEARRSERVAAFAREVGNFARIWKEGEIVAVNGHGDAYRFDERVTGEKQFDIEARFPGIDRRTLMSLADTQEAMRDAARAQWRAERQAEREQARPPSWIENRIADCAMTGQTLTAIVLQDEQGRTVSEAEILADKFRPEGEASQYTPKFVYGAEAFAARLADAGIAITRVADDDERVLKALRHDEEMKRLAAETNRESYAGNRYAELLPGDLAAVTSNGDVYRINPTKLGNGERYLEGQRLPSVTQARDAFERTREMTDYLWAERHSQNAAAREAYAVAREQQHAAAEDKRDRREIWQQGGAALETAIDAASTIFGAASRAFETSYNTLFGWAMAGPRITEQQAHEQAQARGNVETLHAEAYAAHVQANEEAFDWQMHDLKTSQQQHDLNRSQVDGGPPTAEANVGGGYSSRDNDNDRER